MQSLLLARPGLDLFDPDHHQVAGVFRLDGYNSSASSTANPSGVMVYR